MFLFFIWGYFLLWKLIFDVYVVLFFKIWMDFIEGIEIDNFVNLLLDFMFDVFGYLVGYFFKFDKEKIIWDYIRDFDIRLVEVE